MWCKVNRIDEDGTEDVYCLTIPVTGNFVANGIVVKNCDSLRYLCASAFPHGEFGHPDENLTIDQLKRKIYQDDNLGLDFGISGAGGYI